MSASVLVVVKSFRTSLVCMFDPFLAAKILPVLGPKKNHRNRSNAITNSIKTFKMIHVKSIFKERKEFHTYLDQNSKGRLPQP